MPRLNQSRSRAIAWSWMRACEGRRRARRRQGWRGGASPEDRRCTLIQPAGHQIVHGRALHVVGATVHTPRRSGRRSAHPQRPTPKGGGARLAGVRAPVLRCEPKPKNDVDMLLTMWRRVGRAHGRRKGDGEETRRRRQVGRRSGVIRAQLLWTPRT
jgi:hypothetical protein